MTYSTSVGRLVKRVSRHACLLIAEMSKPTSSPLLYQADVLIESPTAFAGIHIAEALGELTCCHPSGSELIGLDSHTLFQSFHHAVE